jgi:hypothetical protein
MLLLRTQILNKSGHAAASQASSGFTPHILLRLSLSVIAVGHTVVQLRLVFSVALPRNSAPIPASNMFLVYVHRFEVVPQNRDRSVPPQRGAYPEYVSQMYVLKRSLRADGSRLGDVIPLENLSAPADLIPRFHGKADVRLTKQSSLEFSPEFLLNKFFEKDLYYAMEKL